MNNNEEGNYHTAAIGDSDVAACADTRQSSAATPSVHVLTLVVSM